MRCDFCFTFSSRQLLSKGKTPASRRYIFKHTKMASARKSSRRSLPMLYGGQQRGHVQNDASFGLAHDLDLYYIRQIASHMKVRFFLLISPLIFLLFVFFSGRVSYFCAFGARTSWRANGDFHDAKRYKKRKKKECFGQVEYNPISFLGAPFWFGFAFRTGFSAIAIRLRSWVEY